MTQAAAATVWPQEQIMGMLIGVVQGRCIVAAAELELADALAKGPLSVETIAAQAKADGDNVFRLMRALETIGFFTQIAPRVFANTPLSECLRKVRLIRFRGPLFPQNPVLFPESGELFALRRGEARFAVRAISSRTVDPLTQGSLGQIQVAGDCAHRLALVQHQPHGLGFEVCRCLRVTRSGFYAWQTRPESSHAKRDRQLQVLVRASFTASKGRYGSPRIHRDLLEEHRERVSRKRVIRLMQKDGLKARVRKRFVCTTDSDHALPVAANLLNREFTAEAPNQRWVGDTTEFKIGESGKLYVAAILDLCSRFVVGWAISAVNDRHVAIAALTMAFNRRCPETGLLHHSDRGSTYASEDYQDRLAAHGITCSMSRTGDCYDNAVMEAFFSTLKTELADAFASHGQAKRELFDYIEGFYNTRRRHSTLGYVSPAVFEQRFRAGLGKERCA